MGGSRKAIWAVVGGLLLKTLRSIPAGAPYPFRPGLAIHLAPFVVGAGARR